MSDKVTLIVSLWLRNGDVDGFEKLEGKLAQLQARHGGRIERAVRITGPGGEKAEEQPFEVHVVTFDDADGLARYRADPQLRELAEVRERIIARTVVLEGRDVDPY